MRRPQRHATIGCIKLLNGAVGVLRAGIAVINEIGAFIWIFGIPAAVAWFLATKYGMGRSVKDLGAHPGTAWAFSIASNAANCASHASRR